MKYFLFCLLLSCFAFGQGSFIPPQQALKVVNGITSPIANATITVCAANASGIPCAPALTNTIFSNSALTLPLSNPFQADANGNYQFAAASTGQQYTVTVSASGFTGQSSQVTLPIGNALQFNPGTFAAAQNNFNLQAALGTATAPSVLSSFNTLGTALCCLTDAFTAATTVPASATGVQADAGGFYIINNSSTLGGGVGGGAVGVYSLSMCTVAGAACWGANPVVTDKAGQASPKLLGTEIDLNAMNTTTSGAALLLNGNFGAQPTNLPAITIIKPNGSGVWSDGYRVSDGSTLNFLAVNIGATGTGNSVNSQTVGFTGRDSGGTNHLVNIYGDQSTNGTLDISTGTPPSFTTTVSVQVFSTTPSGTCRNTTLGINAGAASASTVLYVCLAGTSTWTAVAVP